MGRKFPHATPTRLCFDVYSFTHLSRFSLLKKYLVIYSPFRFNALTSFQIFSLNDNLSKYDAQHLLQLVIGGDYLNLKRKFDVLIIGYGETYQVPYEIICFYCFSRGNNYACGFCDYGSTLHEIITATGTVSVSVSGRKLSINNGSSSALHGFIIML